MSEWGAGNTPKNTLLVDDNIDWAKLTARNLKDHPEIGTVEVAHAANGALSILSDDKSIDCVISDYKLGGATGLELLEHAKEEIPCGSRILITARGNEEIAAQAINAGIDEYMIKDPETDQSDILASKIISVCEERRLREEVKQKKQDYRALVSAVGDAVLYYDGEWYYDDEFMRIAASDEKALQDVELSDFLIQEDTERLREEIEQLIQSDKGTTTEFEAKLSRSDEVTRNCSFDIMSLGKGRVICLLTDITEKTQQTKRLATERDIARRLRAVLAEKGDITDLCEAVCDGLAETGYPLVWASRIDEGELKPLSNAGTQTEYLDEVDLTKPSGNATGEQEPSAWSAFSGKEVVFEDIQSLIEEPWQQRAVEHDFTSAAFIPLNWDGVTYGVLSVYGSVESQIDEALINPVADALSDAISHSIAREMNKGKVSTRIQLHVRDSSYYLARIVDRLEQSDTQGNVTLTETVSVQDGPLLQFVTVPAPLQELFEDVIESAREITEWEVIEEQPDEIRYRICTDGPTPTSLLQSIGGTINSTTVGPDGLVVEADLARSQNIGQTVTVLSNTFDTVEINSHDSLQSDIDQTDRDDFGPLSELTEKQENAILVAYQAGYFDRPRANSAEEVAEMLDVTHPTFLQHLRVAQRKLLNSILKGPDVL